MIKYPVQPSPAQTRTQRRMTPESGSESSLGVPEAPPAGAASRPLTQFLTYRVLRLHHALNAQAVAILARVSGLNLGQWRTLAMIGSGDALTASDLARRTGLDPAFISRTVRSLEEAGLLRTARSDADRRVVTIELTGKGAKLHRRTLPFMQARQEALLAALAPEERDAIFRIIDKLERAARRREFAPEDPAPGHPAP